MPINHWTERIEMLIVNRRLLWPGYTQQPPTQCDSDGAPRVCFITRRDEVRQQTLPARLGWTQQHPHLMQNFVRKLGAKLLRNLPGSCWWQQWRWSNMIEKVSLLRISDCGRNRLCSSMGRWKREIGRYDTLREIRVNHSSLDSPFMVEREREGTVWRCVGGRGRQWTCLSCDSSNYGIETWRVVNHLTPSCKILKHN